MLGQIKKTFFAAALLAFCANGLTANALPANSSVKCAAPGTPREAMQRAAAVFVGEIVKIDEADDSKIIELRVERFWKGAKRKTQTVVVNTGIRYNPTFAIGERYLVYASKNGSDQLVTGRCSRTKLAEYADDDLKALGAGAKP